MEYVRVAVAADVGPGQIVPIEAGDQKLLLANVDGMFYAAQRKCPHLGSNLCRGSLDGKAIVCALHKAKFDLETGQVQRDPKLLFLKMKAKNALQIWPVKVEDGAVLVGL